MHDMTPLGLSPLLLGGLVLLVLVVGLTVVQRRSQRDLTAQPQRPGPAPGPAPAARAPVSPVTPVATARRMTDPLLGPLTFNGTDGWTRDEPLSLGGHDVSLLALAGPEGPSDEHREWVRLTIDRFDVVEADVLALLEHVLQPLGIGRSDVTPFQLMVGPHEAGPFEGRLYYDVAHDEVDSLYVRSVEMWTVLEPYLNEEGGAELTWTLPDRRDELVGAIAFNGDSGWSNREPFVFAGRETQVLYLAGPAGPGPEHRVWLQAAMDQGHDLARRAGAMAAEARGWDPAAVTVAILLVGAGTDGRFVGSLTCHGGSGGPCYVFTHDRFKTLSLERE